jgi:oligoendopeptidase F
MMILSRTLLAAVDPTTATLERSAIEDQFKWDLSKMYASGQEWETHYQQVERMITQFAAKTGKVGDSARSLLDALKLRDQINIQLEKVAGFASLRRDEDMRVSANQALFQRAQTLGVKWGESSAWFQPELLKIPEKKLRDWLKQPDLKVYQHFFDDLLRTRAHILSPREEELLAMSSKATDAFGLLSNTELRWRTVKDPDGKDVEITSSSYTAALQSKTRDFRRAAFEALMSSYLDVKNTLAATLAGAMQRDWFYAKARKYPTALAAALDAENLRASVYDNLVRTVNDHRSSLQRYVALRKRVLKLDQIHFYDLYVNLVDVPERQYSFDEARQLVLAGVKPLGEDYVSVMKQAFESR